VTRRPDTARHRRRDTSQTTCRRIGRRWGTGGVYTAPEPRLACGGTRSLARPLWRLRPALRAVPQLVQPVHTCVRLVGHGLQTAFILLDLVAAALAHVVDQARAAMRGEGAWDACERVAGSRELVEHVGAQRGR
jgi:hypothetical protein